MTITKHLLKTKQLRNVLKRFESTRESQPKHHVKKTARVWLQKIPAKRIVEEYRLYCTKQVARRN